MNVQIVENKELNGTELYFENKPEKEKIEKLKELGYRFHRNKSCWYIRSLHHQKNILELLDANQCEGLTVRDILNEAANASYTTAERGIRECQNLAEGGWCGNAWAKFIANTAKNRSLVKYIKAHSRENGATFWHFETTSGDILLSKGYPNGFVLRPPMPATQMSKPCTDGVTAFSNKLQAEGYDVWVHSYPL